MCIYNEGGKTCARWGELLDPQTDQLKYCSRACAQPNRRARQLLECRQCGKSFERKRYLLARSIERGPFCGMACYAEWQHENTRGPANPSYRASAHHLLTCDWCSRQFSRPKWVRGGRLRFCSRDCFQTFAAERFRRARPLSYGKSWRPAKERALRRDRFQCQDCGTEEQLVVHHLRPYKTFGDSRDAHVLDNLMTLCTACHRRRHNHHEQ